MPGNRIDDTLLERLRKDFLRASGRKYDVTAALDGVTVRLNMRFEVEEVRIEETLLSASEAVRIESAIRYAMNDAVRQVARAHAESLQSSLATAGETP